jgi:two-component system OmpR family sensor kinase
MIKSLRARLTLWYVSVLGIVLVTVSITIHVLLSRELHDRIDANLQAVTGIAVTSLDNDLREGQSVVGAAKSTAEELHSNQAMLAIYDGSGTLLAEAGRDEELHLALPSAASLTRDEPVLFTATESDEDDRHRVAVRRAVVGSHNTEYLIVAGTDLEPTETELASLTRVLLTVIPLALVLAGIVGWFLARHSLSPIVAMAEQARRIGIENLGERLPAVNSNDELGRLATTFNELLDRLSASFAQQRQFMADASHELRTPVGTTRTAATVALQVPHRTEAHYRETLQIVEQQTERLARLVDDMFILARADAGNYPIQYSPMYLDELIEEVARAARVLADEKSVAIALALDAGAAAPYTGDEDLVRRMIVNVVDNAIRHAPTGSTITVGLQRLDSEYEISVVDRGRGIPSRAQPHVFERFYRTDVARGRAAADAGGAGLGLAIARWVARLHKGDISLVDSSGTGTTFSIRLPSDETLALDVPAART